MFYNKEVILIKNKLLISTAAITIVVASVIGVTSALAQNNNGQHQSLIAELAQKLGIDQSKVQTAFDQIKQERQPQTETRYEVMLSQAIQNGKITDTQKQLILDKHKELVSKRQTNWQNLTPRERKDELKKERQDLINWAKQNNIDPFYLWGRRGVRHFNFK